MLRRVPVRTKQVRSQWLARSSVIILVNELSVKKVVEEKTKQKTERKIVEICVRVCVCARFVLPLPIFINSKVGLHCYQAR